MFTRILQEKFYKQYPFPTKEGAEVLCKLNEKFTSHYFSYYFYGECPDTSFYDTKRALPNVGEGNCLFLSVAALIQDKLEIDHSELRRQTAEFMEKNLEPLSIVFNQKEEELEKHVNEIAMDGKYGSSEAIYALACFLNCTIKIYLEDDERAIVFYPNNNYRRVLDVKRTTIHLVYSQTKQHYQALQ